MSLYVPTRRAAGPRSRCVGVDALELSDAPISRSGLVVTTDAPGLTPLSEFPSLWPNELDGELEMDAITDYLAHSCSTELPLMTDMDFSMPSLQSMPGMSCLRALPSRPHFLQHCSQPHVMLTH